MSNEMDPYHPVYEEADAIPVPAACPRTVRRKGKSSISHRLRRAVFDRDGGCCVYCSKPLTYMRATMDHIVPVSRNGTSKIHNLATSCGGCNANKDDKRVESWASAKALLRIQRIRADTPEKNPE